MYSLVCERRCSLGRVDLRRLGLEGVVCPRAALKINIAIGTDAVGSLIPLGLAPGLFILGSGSIGGFWAWKGWSVLVPHLK